MHTCVHHTCGCRRRAAHVSGPGRVCCGCHHQALESSLAEAFDVNRAAATISITSTLPSGGDVGDVWAAMELAGSLDKHLQSVASEWG